MMNHRVSEWNILLVESYKTILYREFRLLDQNDGNYYERCSVCYFICEFMILSNHNLEDDDSYLLRAAASCALLTGITSLTYFLKAALLSLV